MDKHLREEHARDDRIADEIQRYGMSVSTLRRLIAEDAPSSFAISALSDAQMILGQGGSDEIRERANRKINCAKFALGGKS